MSVQSASKQGGYFKHTGNSHRQIVIGHHFCVIHIAGIILGTRQ